jgi:hypothetical protein
MLLALGSTLFARGRDRAVALGVFWLFSGVHQLARLALVAPAAGAGPLGAAGNLGQSHAGGVGSAPCAARLGLCGVLSAVAARARARLGDAGAGALDDTVFAAGRDGRDALCAAWRPGGLRRGQIGAGALAGCALALVSLPGVLFLLSGSAQVGGALGGRLPLAGYGCFVALELGGYLAALAAAGRRQPLVLSPA